MIVTVSIPALLRRGMKVKDNEKIRESEVINREVEELEEKIAPVRA